jgi:cytochrome o ubiquinol oxidase subunit 1
VNAFFGLMTMIIAVPTGVKVFNWIFTMFGGRVRVTTPMLWSLGFICTFVIGGMTGVLMAIPPADFVLHNSLFLVAHFHNVIIGGVLFGAFAGYTYWFPKAFGFTLDERLGKAAFWCWLGGFYLAFMPLYLLGLMGATRRMNHYDVPGWQPLMIAALAGALLILLGLFFMALQLWVSIRTRDRRRDVDGDPWHGRTLEWSTSSPPPAWNYSILPQVKGIDAYWAMKQSSQDTRPANDEDAVWEAIPVPRRSAVGVVLAFFSVVTGFALVWHIWWMAIAGVIGLAATGIAHGWRVEHEEEIPVEVIARTERARRRTSA